MKVFKAGALNLGKITAEGVLPHPLRPTGGRESRPKKEILVLLNTLRGGGERRALTLENTPPASLSLCEATVPVATPCWESGCREWGHISLAVCAALISWDPWVTTCRRHLSRGQKEKCVFTTCSQQHGPAS